MKIEFSDISDFDFVGEMESTVFSVFDDIQVELEKEGVAVGVEYFLSVVFVDKAEMKKLNYEYRKKDEPTDILSFAYDQSEREIQGELILCPEVIWENAKEDGIEPINELIKNFIHGILHIAGYEHGDEMFGIQDVVLKNLLVKYN